MEVEICIKHDVSGRELKKLITLTEDESEAVEKLQNESDRQAYIYSIPTAKKALSQLASEAKLLSACDDASPTSEKDIK